MRGSDACSAQMALRSDWRLAGFIHFCRLFADALQISSFPAERLERAILLPHQETVLLDQLLSAFLGNADWQSRLSQKLKRQWRDIFTVNPLVDGSTFFDLEPLQRVRSAAHSNILVQSPVLRFLYLLPRVQLIISNKMVACLCSLLSCMGLRSGG